MSKKLNVVKRPLTGALLPLLLLASISGSAACYRTREVKVEVPVEKVALCQVPEVPLPEGITASACVTQDGTEAVCMTPEVTWSLDRWFGAMGRWVALVSACPGVVVGPSGVTEELDKLRAAK